MSTITKEWLQSQISAIKAVGITDSNTLLAFEIALASLEAEAVGEVVLGEYDDCGCHPDAKVVCIAADGQADWGNFKDGTPLYAAPPAPANAEPVAWLWSHRKHPSEVTLVRPEDDEMAEPGLWSGWSCQALYAAPPAPVSVPDYPETLPCPVILEPGLRFGKGVNTRTMLGALQRRAEYYAELKAMTPEQRDEHDAGMKEFAAMLQGAENAESPTTMQAAPVLDSSPKIAESPSGNSPVIPDGWVMVPVEPTKEMIDAGWSYYMTTKSPSSLGVYGAMLAAAPKQEVKNG